MTRNEMAIYKKGFIDGLTAYAYHSDGQQYVGTTGKTLKAAVRYVEQTWNFRYDIEQLTECQNCSNICPEDDLVPIEEVRDLCQRVAPGERMPAGECRKCGALAHLTKE